MKRICLIFTLVCCAAPALYADNYDVFGHTTFDDEKVLEPLDACPYSDRCPRDRHTIGTPCPHDHN